MTARDAHTRVRLGSIVSMLPKKRVVLNIVLSTTLSLVGLLSLMYPVLLRDFLDFLTRSQFVWDPILKMCALAGISLVADATLVYLYSKSHTKLQAFLKTEIFRRALQIPPTTIKEKGEGYFSEMIGTAAESTVFLFSPITFKNVFAIGRACIIIFLLFAQDIYIGILGAVLFLTSVGAFYLNRWIVIPRVDNLFEQIRVANSEIVNRISIGPYFLSMRMFRPFVTKRVNQTLESAAKAELQLHTGVEVLHKLTEKLAYPALRIVAIIRLGGLLLSQQIAMPELFMLLTYFGMLEIGIGGLNDLSEMVFNAQVAVAGLRKFFFKEQTLTKPADSSDGYFVMFDGVDLSFGENEVFRKLNLTLDEGLIHVLVGKSGVGKSSFLNVISGQLTPNAGAVFVRNGSNNARTTDFSSVLAVMHQEAPILDGTLRDNICLGVQGRDDEVDEIVQTLKIAYLDSRTFQFNGRDLSGGEKKKVNIARFFFDLKDKPWFLLDEGFASVDAVSKETMLRLLEQSVKGKTGIIVSHDPSVIGRFPDNVVYLAEPGVARKGGFAELKSNLYEFHELYA